jgi:2-oxoglutarate ferredoxin oxidoreductase subunit beta
LEVGSDLKISERLNFMIDLNTDRSPTWCPGCGNFGIWAAFKQAATENNWDSANSVLVAGIGCHGHILNFTKITSFNGLHGRAIPVATGIKLVNPKLNTFVFTGDGDCLGEGGNHLIHACRRNHDLTIILHDNALYSLTTGQTSPMSPKGAKTKSTPDGNPDEPFFPLALAISAGATFAARAFSADIPRLADLIARANRHQGLAIIDVLQPCATFNKDYTYQFFQENTYFLDKDYDPTNKFLAIEKASEWGPKQIPLGIFYQVQKETFSYPEISLEVKERDIFGLLNKCK